MPANVVSRLSVRVLCLTGLLALANTATADELPIIPPADAYGLERVTDGPFQHDDNDGYYGLLDHASLVPEEDLKEAGRQFLAARKAETQLPTFLDMIRNPKAFRGQPVYFTGHVLQTQKYEANPNDYGIETLYEVSLFIEDAQAHPITVVFLEKPEALEVGGDMVDGIRVAGYFLKNHYYPSADKHTRVAPLIMANRLTIRPAAKPAPLVSSTVAYSGALIIFGLLVAIVWYIQRSDRKRMLKRQQQESPESPDFKDINVPTTPFGS